MSSQVVYNMIDNVTWIVIINWDLLLVVIEIVIVLDRLDMMGTAWDEIPMEQ